VPGPLAGLRLIDLSQVLSGPYCTMLLADLGADVVKVEPPGGDVTRGWGPHLPGEPADGYGGYFASVNRNKRSVRLDLKAPGDRERFLALLGTADVLVENFRVGVMERLGLSYEDLHARFPRLVYAAVRGFGDPRTGDSPYADWPAFDIIAQAMGGLIGITGPDPDHPVKAGPGIGDIFPAALAAVGILAAVRHAQATGAGQFVDVAMYDGIVALNERIVYQHAFTGRSPGPQGNTHPLLCPYGLVPTLDGWVSVAAPSDRHWRLLAGLLGAPELGDVPAYATNAGRLERSAEVYRLISDWTRGRSTAQVVATLAGKVPCGPVHRAADIADDPHIRLREMVVAVEHPGSGRTVRIAGTPVKFTGTPTGAPRRAPLLGEHTAELLAELGGSTTSGGPP
jgi:crotonobetainyl-CoA:carnitine CoA-transferase CaiB-like acyl-CoA transferase